MVPNLVIRKTEVKSQIDLTKSTKLITTLLTEWLTVKTIIPVLVRMQTDQNSSNESINL